MSDDIFVFQIGANDLTEIVLGLEVERAGARCIEAGRPARDDALDHGIPQSAAVLLVGVIGVGSTAGRFFLGGLADRLGRPLSFLAMFAGMGFSFVIWLFSASLWELGVFAFVYGVFYGGFVALAPAVVIDYFGGRNASSLIGILYTSVAFGTLIGPTAAGFAFDIRHSYTLPIALSIVAYALATAVLGMTSKAPRSR